MLHKYDENIYLKAFRDFFLLFDCSLTKYSCKMETQIEEYLLNTLITIIIDKNYGRTKGQLISKAIYSVLDSSKKRTKKI